MTDNADFTSTLREMRRHRLQGALGMQQASNGMSYRRELLHSLETAASRPDDPFNTLSPDLIDAATSVAMLDSNERATDKLYVLLLCTVILGRGHQFARLHAIGSQFTSLAKLIRVDRPILAEATYELGSILRGEVDGSASTLREVSQRSETALSYGDRKGNLKSDFLLAMTMLTTLERSDPSLLQRAESAAIQTSDGLLHAFLQAWSTWTSIREQSATIEILANADPIFKDLKLQEFLTKLPITLFPAQVYAIQSGITHDESKLLSLPTSSGKTLLAELRIVASLRRKPDECIVYLAPYRLLARQVTDRLSSSLKHLNYSVSELDSPIDDFPSLPNVVVSTPERLDLMTRTSGDGRETPTPQRDLLRNCSVLIIDEIQLINRAGRGVRLELFITRLKLKYPSLKILGLTAASTAATRLSNWLTGDDPVVFDQRTTGLLEVIWETSGRLRQRTATTRATEIGHIERTGTAVDDAARLLSSVPSSYFPTLAVETSRRNAEGLAERVTQQYTGAEWSSNLNPETAALYEAELSEIRKILGSDHKLVRCLRSGVAIHHAGLPTTVLQRIERLAKNLALRSVISTTTVAEGADLPFQFVIIPHLNFEGNGRRIDRELYQNIIGRTARAGKSAEGIVVILDSEAKSFHHYIRRELWSNRASAPITGQIGKVSQNPSSLSELASYLEVQSQIMAWLGDGNSYVENQPAWLSAKLLSSQTSIYEATAVPQLIQSCLEDLERGGYALAASPFRLTSRGKRARQTGLSTLTISRLSIIITEHEQEVRDLATEDALNEISANFISFVIFNAVEVVPYALASSEFVPSPAGEALPDHFDMGDTWPIDTSDISLFAGWILGETNLEVSRRAPDNRHPLSLFGSAHLDDLTADAVHYLTRIAEPAGWVWQGFTKLAADELRVEFSPLIFNSIINGVPTSFGSTLVEKFNFSRQSAILLDRLRIAHAEDFTTWLEDMGDTVSPDYDLLAAERDTIRNNADLIIGLLNQQP